MSTTRYVWGQYTKDSQIGYRTRYRDSSSSSSGRYTVNIGQSTTFQMSSGYTFSKTSGRYTKTGVSTYQWHSYAYNYGSGYIALSGGDLVYSGNWSSGWVSSDNAVVGNRYTIHSAEPYKESYTYYVQGSFIKNISNKSSSAYPNDDLSSSVCGSRFG